MSDFLGFGPSDGWDLLTPDQQQVLLDAEACGVKYGSNPDGCNEPTGHRGPHSNQWGTTWTEADQ